MITPHYQLSRRLVTGLKRCVIGASITLLANAPYLERTSRAEDIAPMFAATPHNVALPRAFEQILARYSFGETPGGEAL